MSVHDDHENTFMSGETRDAPSRLLQQCLSAEHGAKLLGPVITDELPRQWPKPPAVAAGENECPSRLRARRYHDVLASNHNRAGFERVRHDSGFSDFMLELVAISSWRSARSPSSTWSASGKIT